MSNPGEYVDPLTGQLVRVRSGLLPGGPWSPDRSVDRVPAMGDMRRVSDPRPVADHALAVAQRCPPGWWFHDRQEFRMSAAAATVIATFKVELQEQNQPGFFLRIQTPYENFLNNTLVANGAQAPAMTFRVRVNAEVLNRDFVPSAIDGSFWVPYCVRNEDTIEITAIPIAGIAGQFSNSPIRTACEIAVGGELPYLTPLDRRRNTVRTFSVALAAIPIVPTIAIGAASIFVATIPNAPWFIVPGSLKAQALPGSAPIFWHGVSVAGAIDAGGQQLDNVVGLPADIDVDRLDKVAFSKPAAAAGTLTISFALYD